MELRELILATGVLAACGDNLPERRCVSIEEPGTVTCWAALSFAARDTAELVPTQEEVDRYHDRWRRTVEAEPILEYRLPQRYRTGAGNSTLLFTRNQQVIDAWMVGIIETGDPTFDTIISELRPVALHPYWKDYGDGSFYFSLRSHGVSNEELLHERLLATSSWLDDPVYRPQDDGHLTWQSGQPGTGSDGDTAIIEFTFGWGDCLAGCSGFRTLRAFVPPGDVPATVYDMGGDQLPDHLQLSPNTKPWPQ
jgi:hypothetical protein